MAKQKRYYKVEETVYVKAEKTFGVIKKLNIKPSEDVYRATVEVTRKKDDVTHITTKEYELWEIDKDKRNYRKPYKKKEEILQVPIKYFDSSLPEIEEIEIGDWVDLYARKDLDMSFLQHELIPLNVAMELPDNYEAHILPRSSTYKRWGIIIGNGKGVVDNSYRGDDDEWLFSAIALRETAIKKGDKIAQFRISEKMPKTKFPKVEVLGNENRGGHGTTGDSVIK